MVVYSCNEHIDQVLEEMVDEYEIAPEMMITTEEERQVHTCMYCKQNAQYKLTAEIEEN